jgi:plastocyanin
MDPSRRSLFRSRTGGGIIPVLPPAENFVRESPSDPEPAPIGIQLGERRRTSGAGRDLDGEDDAVFRYSSLAKIFLPGLTVLLFTALLSGCKPPSGGGSAGTGTPSPQVLSGKLNVILQDYKFNPGRLTIKAGSTIIWINRDPAFHTIVSDTGVFRSSLLSIGQLFSYTFDEPGTYPYYCENSGGPGGEGMSGVITVVP